MFKTKEFAKMVGTTEHTLRHYDKIGLFKPHAVGEQGYRFYSKSQIANILKIIGLTDCGFTLPEIGKMLSMSDSEWRKELQGREEYIDHDAEAKKLAIHNVTSDIDAKIASCMGKSKRYAVKRLYDYEDRMNLESLWEEFLSNFVSEKKKATSKYVFLKCTEIFFKNCENKYANRAIDQARDKLRYQTGEEPSMDMISDYFEQLQAQAECCEEQEQYSKDPVAWAKGARELAELFGVDDFDLDTYIRQQEITRREQIEWKIEYEKEREAAEKKREAAKIEFRGHSWYENDLGYFHPSINDVQNPNFVEYIEFRYELNEQEEIDVEDVHISNRSQPDLFFEYYRDSSLLIAV